MYGYAGKLLRVDLEKGQVSEEPLSEQMARTYLGGRGFAARILYDEVEEGVDPLGPASKMIVATGTLTGTPAPAGNRTLVAAKSPLTGIWGDSAMGGSFGGQLKSAGIDAVIIQGVSSRPVYLWIHDGQAEIKEASHIWGKETGPAQEAILREVGKAIVLGIGPAGENLVRYASALGELHFAAGRAGIGAVLGSKKVKAIAVRGTKRVAIAEPEKLGAFRREVYAEIRENEGCKSLNRYGTWNNLTPLQRFGILPTKNFQSGVIEGGERLESEAVVEAILTNRRTCPNCPVFCRRVVEMKEPYELSGIYGGPQYETMASMGSMLLNTNPAVVAKAHELCNRYGVDTISAGNCIAWGMECWERGIDLGRPLPWGDPETIFTLIEEIAYRRGIGGLLADGIRRASAELGQGSEAWANQVKGLEFALHDPRGKKAMGLGYATANRGACHLQTVHEEALERDGAYPELALERAMRRTQYEGKPYMVKVTQDYFGTLGDSLGVCKFLLNVWRPLTPTRLAEVVQLVTGWDISLQELLTAGERIYNLCRMFNVREGISRTDDVLSQRMSEPLPEGGSAGETVTPEALTKMLDEYYELRGWDEKGIPRDATLSRLGLAR